jgi:type VI secretion system secreted protein VgrG
MADYKQDNRLMAISTPLGADVLLLEAFRGTESLSQPFHLELDVLSVVPYSWTYDQLLGQNATVTISLPESGSARYFNGVIAHIDQRDRTEGARGVVFQRFRLGLVPQLWLLGLNRNSRIFQQLNVIDILKTVLTGVDVSWQTQGTYQPRDYCVQYRESDLAFASRLMEEEGIYYYFKHADGSHQMVVSDTPQSHEAVPGPTEISYQPGDGGLHPDDRILKWAKLQELRSGKVTLWDQCFELPGQNLEATKTVADSVNAGTVSHKLQVANNASYEQYDFPGGYAQRFDGIDPGGSDRASDVQNIFTDNTRTATIRMAQQTTGAIRIAGQSVSRQMASGHKFTLSDHPDANGDYVITRIEHRAALAGVYTSDTDKPSDAYTNRFECQPAALPFVPPRVTPRPTMPGPQTATVVGPSGEEIFTDKYGRIKVQFPWDRQGANDANSSCWIRVGTPWAGKQWGMIHIPRIGQEVIVAFEEGDPDRPIVVGSVYNAAQMPPYVLPDNRTQSGLKTRSSLEGTEENFNELRFEDKKDEEQIYFHAEKNFDRVVENNDTLKVGFEKKDKGDQTIEIFNNRSLKVGAGAGDAEDGSETIDIFNKQNITIGSGEANAADGSQTISIYKDRTTTIQTGNETLTIQQGNRAVTLDQGNESLTVAQGTREVTVEGDDTLTIKTGNGTIKANSGSITIEAATNITLKVGGNSIEITTSGITIKAAQVQVTGDSQVSLGGPIIQASADGMLELKGGMVTIN